MVGVYITKAGGDCYCYLVVRRRPGMSDDGPGTTLALSSTNNQINPPGVWLITLRTLQLAIINLQQNLIKPKKCVQAGWAGLTV